MNYLDELKNRLINTAGEIEKVNNLNSIIDSSLAVKYLRALLHAELRKVSVEEAAIHGAYVKGYETCLTHLENFMSIFLTKQETVNKVPPATYGSRKIIKETMFTSKEDLDKL